MADGTITGENLVHDSAISKLALLDKGLLKVADSLDLIIKDGDSLNSSLKDNATSFTILGEEQNKLNKINADYLKAQKEVQKQSKTTSEQNKEQKKQQDGLNDSTEQAGKSSTKYKDAMSQLKSELKAAKAEMASVAKTLGTDSEEFAKATAKAGELKDQINDLNDALKNAEASKFENLGKSLGDVGSKLLSLDFGGAATSARQFASVTKSINVKDVTSALKDMGSTLVNVGKGILTNSLFLLAAVLGGIIYTVIKFRNEIKPVKYVFDLVGDSIDFVVQKLKDFTDWIGITTFAESERTKKIIDNAEVQIEATKKYYDTAIKLAEAAGKKTENLEREKWKEVKAIAEKGLNAAFDPKKSLADQSDEVKTFYAVIEEATVSLTTITLQEQAKRAAAWKKLYDYNKELQSKNEDAEIVSNVRMGEEATKALEDAFISKQEYADATLEIEEGITDKELEEIHKRIKAREDAQEKQKKDAINAAQIAYDGVTSIALQAEQDELGRINNQLSASQKARADGLTFAKDNEEQKAAVNAKYDAIDRKLKHDQAVQEKKLAQSSILINTARGVAQALSTGNIFSAAAIGALGLYQYAKASSVPIPALFKGTKDFEGGAAFVGERGTEIIQEPGKDAYFSPSVATLVNLPKHTQVLTHEETVNAIARNGNKNIGTPGVAKQDTSVGDKIDKLIHVVKNKRETHWNISEKGVEKIFKQAEARIKILNDLY